MSAPRSGQLVVSLGHRKFNLDLAGVQVSVVEVFEGCLSLFVAAEADKAELTGLLTMEHDLGIGDCGVKSLV